MGSSKSKVRKLNPKTIKELQQNVDVDFTRDEIEQWFREYQGSLRKGLNKLTMTEFMEVYRSVFDGEPDDFVKHLFRSFDADKDGYVDFKEFIVGLCVSGSENVDTKLKWAFKMYDLDGNGSITRDEMAGMLRAIYKMVSPDNQRSQDSADEIEDLIVSFFDSADKNKDDAISEDEFVQGVKDMPIILQLLQADPGKDSKFDSIDEDTDIQPVKQVQPDLSATGKKYAY